MRKSIKETPCTKTTTVQELYTLDEILQAIKNGEFVVYLQPKINLSTGKIIGAEALARWSHPTKGVLPPSTFIPILEKNGAIFALDEYIWRETCKTMVEFRKKGYTKFPISVNVSRLDIYNPNLLDILLNAVSENDLLPKDLELEITESAYTDNAEQVIEVAQKLKNFGFSLQMDDFGTGYSSLNMLNDVPVDVLKLDMRFLSNEKVNVRSGNILTFIVSMANWMKLTVIAEGVETVDQVEYLRSMGCNIGQGYYFAQPLSCEEFAQFCHQNDIESVSLLSKNYATTLDEGEIWKPNSGFNNLFNSFVGALGIVQWENGQLTFIRVNDTFYRTIGMTTDQLFETAYNILDIADEETRQYLLDVLKSLSATNGEITFNSHWVHPIAKKKKWLHAKLKVLASSHERTLILVSIEDISKEKEVEIQLKVSEARFKAAATNAVNNMWEYDIANKKIRNFSDSMKNNGWNNEVGDVPESLIANGHIHADSIADIRELYARVNDGESPVTKNIKLLRIIDNVYVWNKVTYSTIFDDENNHIIAIGTGSDVTLEVEAMQKYQLKCETFREASLGDLAHFVVNLSTKKLIEVSDNLKITSECVEGCDFGVFYNELKKYKIHPDDLSMCDDFIASNYYATTTDIEHPIYFEHRYHAANAPLNEYVWAASTTKLIKQPTTSQIMAFVSIKNINAVKLADISSAQNAEKDAVTNLFNRSSFESLATMAIEASVQKKSITAILLIDVDAFRQVKSELGQQIGDELLGKIADKLRSNFRASSDVMARLDDDEFAVVLANIPTVSLAFAKGIQMCNAVKNISLSVPYGDITAAVGIAIAPLQGDNFDMLYHEAEIALCEAKQLSQDKCCLFNNEAATYPISSESTQIYCNKKE